MKKSTGLAIAMVTVLAVLPGQARAAAFLKIEGVQGGVTAPHAGWIEVSSYSLGSGLPAHAGAGGAAKTSHGPSSIHFAARTSPAIVKLAEASDRGTHFATATLEVFKGGGVSPYLRYKMTDVMVSSYQTGGSGGGGGEPFDQFVLNFSKVELEYLQPSPPTGSGVASAASAKGATVLAAQPGTITVVKVQPAEINAGATVTITVEGSGECKLAWIDFGDHSQAEAALFGSPFPKTFAHAFTSPGTFTVVAWGYDPESPKQRTEAKAGTCVGKKSATVQVRSRMMVAPAPKK